VRGAGAVIVQGCRGAGVQRWRGLSEVFVQCVQVFVQVQSRFRTDVRGSEVVQVQRCRREVVQSSEVAAEVQRCRGGAEQVY
jgi:hypothetical protein